jgi:tetratricopeptide (TPR) repeat protein
MLDYYRKLTVSHFSSKQAFKNFMKKYFLIVGLVCSCCFQSTSQVVSSAVTDSLSLEHAMKTVNSLKDSAKVDMLNSIAARTPFILSHETRIAIQYKYATKALQEASRLNYKAGIARALLTLSATSFFPSMNMPGDTVLKNGYFLKAFKIAQEINNHELLGCCYYTISGMPSYTKNNTDNIITYYNKAIDNFLKAKDTLFAAETTAELGYTYSTMGDYEHAFDYARKSLYLAKKSGTDFSLGWKQYNVQAALSELAGLYTTAGDHETAMNYILENERYGKENKSGWENFDRDIANLYCSMGRYDSALAIANRMDTFVPVGIFPGRSALLGEIYLNGTKEYNKAIKEFTRVRDTVVKHIPDTIYSTAQWLIKIGQAYDGKKEYNTALEYAGKGIVLLEEKNNRPEMMRGYQVLSTIYHHLGNNDMAYEYLVKYNTIKDSIQNKQFLLRIYNAKKDAEDEKKEAKVTLLDKDNKIKKQQLSQQAMLRNFLLVMLLVLMAAAAFIFRNLHLKRKNEQLQNGKQQAELKEHAARLEMQALRAQMNPHFIFNCLSSINSFILDNDTDTASDYLTRFSRLIRMVLTNSEKSLITLEEELKMLRLYMDMERLRFENAFDYTITYTNDVDVETLMVPPLLLQPFCENAIWHGLMHKEGKGHLTITIIKKEEYIHCIITDDGIGRSKAEELNSKSANKEKSMGLKITNERLSLFNNEEGVATAYEIEDILDSTGTVTGTKVNLKIRHKNLMEKIA